MKNRSKPTSLVRHPHNRPAQVLLLRSPCLVPRRRLPPSLQMRLRLPLPELRQLAQPRPPELLSSAVAPPAPQRLEPKEQRQALPAKHLPHLRGLRKRQWTKEPVQNVMSPAFCYISAALKYATSDKFSDPLVLGNSYCSLLAYLLKPTI